jgi:NADH:ubiquinone reductase (H+-translocating)
MTQRLGRVPDPAQDDGRPQRHRVVVIGSGFGGLFAVKALQGAPADVTLIDRTTHHLFQPLLYQVATGILSEGEIAPPIRDIFKRERNTDVLLGEVTGIDLTQRAVTSELDGHATVTSYDSLIVAAGAGPSYFGNEQFAAVAPGLKSIDDALTHRQRIFAAFEFADQAESASEREQWLTFAVVGGGPTGVEMAGQLAELSRRSLRDNYRQIDPAASRIVVVEAGPALLAEFGLRLSRKTTADLRKLGIEVLLDTRVVGVDDTGVDTESAAGPQRIPARTIVWAAGVSASPLGGLVANATGAETNRHGQVAVNPDCTLPGHPEVFVVGDLMQISGTPGVAQVAIQSGRFAAKTIRDRLQGRPPRPHFHYRDKGMLATISRFRAVAAIGPLRIGGTPAWVLWLGVHLFYLVGFKNRVTVVLHWAVSFLGKGRSERTAPSLRRSGTQLPPAGRPPMAPDLQTRTSGE